MSGNGRRFEHAARCQGWPGPMQYRECKMVWDLQGAGAMLGQCPRVEPADKLPSGATATWAPGIVPLNLFWLEKKFLYRRKISSICSEFQHPGQFRQKKKKKIQKVKKKHLPPNSGGLEFSGYFILDLKTVKHQPCQEERELLNLSQKNDNCRIKMYTVCLGA